MSGRVLKDASQRRSVHLKFSLCKTGKIGFKHFRSLQICFNFPQPPNLGISLHFTHNPQGFLWQLTQFLHLFLFFPGFMTLDIDFDFIRLETRFKIAEADVEAVGPTQDNSCLVTLRL